MKVHAVLQDPTSTKPVDDPVRGRQLFIKDGCFECHGTEGQGGGYTGPRIAPPPPLSSVLSQLRHPSDQMPPFTEKVLSDTDVADIFAFLQSIPVVHLTLDELIHKGYGAANRTHTTMPQFSASSMNPDQYINIHAYLFQVNSFPAGTETPKQEPSALMGVAIGKETSSRIGH